MTAVPQYQQLEEEFGKFANEQNVVACSSGTAALHLALEALQLPLGSGVVVPDYTMIACARAITLAGLIPVIVDCDHYLGMDWGSADKALETGSVPISAIMPVHIYGRCCDMGHLGGLAYKYGLRVIEDCAEIHGVNLGWITDARCWSFYKNKIIFGEEGGAVAFGNYDHATRAKSLRNHGFTDAHDFSHLPRGCNYRLANMLAQQIRVSVHYAKRNLEKRRAIESWYERACPITWRMPAREAPWVYDIRIPGLLRWKQIELVKALNAAGIEARCGFKPLSMQEEYGRNCFVKCPNALRAYGEVFYLPIAPGEVTEATAAQAFQIIQANMP